MSSGASKSVQSAPPPYLHLAVMEELRESVVSRHAAVVFTPDLDRIIWTNAEGAALLGATDIRDAQEDSASGSNAAARQIKSASARIRRGNAASAVLRATRGARTAIVPFTLSPLTLADGTETLLLVTEDLPGSRDALAAQARFTVNGLAGYGHAAAVLGENGSLVSASQAFSRLAIPDEELAAICGEVGSEDDRLVKRLLSTSAGERRAGIACLQDDPALHLIIVALSDDDAEGDESSPSSELFTQAEEPKTKTPLRRWYYGGPGEQLPPVEPAADAAEPDETNEPPLPPTAKPDAEAQPVRFLWSVDGDFRFDSVSPELAGAVGEGAADIEELTWTEVAAKLGFENGDTIMALLEKGDTWSNKTVSWPIEGTDMRVPVDLSGLPMRARDGRLAGFNGFGIVRIADAIISDAQPPVLSQSIPMDGNLSPDERTTFATIGKQLSDADGPSDGAEPSAAQEPDVAAAPVTEPETADKTEPDTSILAKLSIPVLVYRDTELLFANSHFSETTGYKTLDDLASAGGVETLFGTPEQRMSGDSAAPIFHADGRRLNVRAHIQKVPWDEKPAMQLTLRNKDGKGGPPSPEKPPQKSPEKQDGKPKPAKAAAGNAGPKPFAVIKGGNDDTPQSFAGLGADDLRGILDTASDGVLILTPKGKVLAANRSAEALFDRPAEEMSGADLTDLLAPESHHSALDYLASVSQPGLAQLLNDGREMMLRTPRGGIVPVFMTVGPLTTTGTRLCAVMRDITPWKKGEEELLRAKARAENASEQKSDFLARISHEIRTPLNAIIGFSDIMVSERFGPIENDRYRGYLRDIHTSGRHVLDLINDLLDISKIEAGKMELSFDSCELNTLVSNTVALMQADANKERVIIRTSLSAAVPKVVADPRSLKQVILNLVSNAIKYTSAGGQVIVSTVLEEAGEVVLRVRDTGIGMSAQDLQQALQPFQQVTTVAAIDRQVTGGGAGGTGLGLPLTRALVEANHAHFRIESEPDEGTLVEVRFQPERVIGGPLEA